MIKGANIKKLLKGSVKAEMPINIEPMAFKLSPEAFNDEACQFEIKWDGFRILSYSQGNKVDLRSRNNSNFNKRFSAIKEELQSLNINAVFDGEAVILNEDGCSDFNQIMDGGTECLVYYVFDILWYEGYNLMNLPLSTRREILKSILPPSNIIRFSDHVDENGRELFELAKDLNIEGIVAKNKDSHYIPGIRTSQWLKIKTVQVAEALVAGILLDTEKQGSGFSSLIVGVEEISSYKYIGLVETGISKTDLQTILTTGKATNKSIFTPVPNVNKQVPFRKKIKKPDVIWLEPDIRCNVKFLDLDKFGMMRHASFKGLLN